MTFSILTLIKRETSQVPGNHPVPYLPTREHTIWNNHVEDHIWIKYYIVAL